MSANTGNNMKLYYNSNTHASPTWVEVSQVGDVSISDLTMGTADLKRRASGWSKALATFIQPVTVEFRLVHGVGPTAFDRIRADFFAGTAREWAIMDGDISTPGNEGLKLPALMEKFPWDQPLEDVTGHDCGLKLAYMEESGSEVDAEWFEVS